MNPPERWMATRGRGARVLVLDSGLRPEPYLTPIEVRGFTPSGDTDDAIHHGTRVARLIACGHPGRPGLAPLCHLYVGKVVCNTYRRWSTLTAALDWALDIRPDVLCMAFTVTSWHPDLAARLDRLEEWGTIALAAYGHQQDWPHRHPGVISVGRLVDRARCQLVADDALEPDFRGTSAATAAAAAVAACAKAAEPGVDRAAFLRAVRTRAR